MIRQFWPVAVFSLALLALTSSQSPGEPVCRVLNPADGSGGSGTHIASDGRSGLLATCWHIFRDAPRGDAAVILDGRHYRGEIVARNPQLDLALIRFPDPGSPPAEIGPANRAGEWTVKGYGMGGRRFAKSVGRFIEFVGLHGSQGVLLSNDVESGDSGGGVFNENGQWVGVIWGRDYERGSQGNAHCSVGRNVGQWLLTQCGPNGCCPVSPQVYGSMQTLADGIRRPAVPEPPRTFPIANLERRAEPEVEPQPQDGIALWLAAGKKQMEDHERRITALEMLLKAAGNNTTKDPGLALPQLPQQQQFQRQQIPQLQYVTPSEYLRLLLLSSRGQVLVDEIISAEARLRASRNLQ